MRAYSIHTDHLTVVRITRRGGRRKCYCGCGRRATHYLAADGCNMGEGCEWSMCQQGEAEIRAYQAIWGSKDITDYERDVLRSLAGENVPGLMWGAAMAAAIEYLTGRGYVKRQIRFDGGIEYVITDIGRSALESTSTKRSPAPP